jgi:hypothetical protein
MSVRNTEHPGYESLFEYAEQLDAGRVSFDSPVGEHIRDCAECSAEVDSVRRSLSLTRLASPTIEPTIALEASTILGMKSEWLAHRRRVRRRVVKTTAFAAVFVVSMSVTLSSSARPGESGISKTYPRSGEHGSTVSYQTLVTESPEERLLEPAILQSSWEPANPWERSQRRALDVLDGDIDEALAAIQSNPALVRAGTVVNANRETKRQTLKSLYAQRDL